MSSDDDVVALFMKESGRLRGYLVRQGASPELADDCVSDAFLAAARTWERIRDTNPRAYVYTVARHQMFAEWRRGGRELPTDVHTDVSDHDSDPSDLLIRREQMTAMRRAFGRMPPGRQSETITLRYVQEFSVRETATILGISEGAVKRYTHDGLTTLRTLVDEETGGEARR